MKRKIIFILLAFLMCLFTVNVYADDACNYKVKANLNREAALVKTNYEVIERKEQIVPGPNDEFEEYTAIYYSFKITVYNITDDLYINISSSNNDINKKVYYKDTTEGKYSFTTDNQEDIIKYTINIYPNVASCGSTKLKSYVFTKPKYNMYSKYGFCKEHPDLSYCQKFLTKDIELNDGIISNYADEYATEEQNTNQNNNSFWNFIKNNYLYILGGIIIIGGITTGTIVIIKKRRKF
jgi:hypothetical protein